MDPLSAILFLIVGFCLGGLWRFAFTIFAEVRALKAQMGRFESDIESEKGTRRRQNQRFNDRIRSLEKLPPLPNDHQEEE